MWIIPLIYFHLLQLDNFLVEFFYFIWKYTIFYFFASITDNPEEPPPSGIQNVPQTQLTKVIKNAKENN
jgi:hypothetical protein